MQDYGPINWNRNDSHWWIAWNIRKAVAQKNNLGYNRRWYFISEIKGEKRVHGAENKLPA